jgi:hypothetical protein
LQVVACLGATFEKSTLKLALDFHKENRSVLSDNVAAREIEDDYHDAKALA